jgi:hypothetical protein
MKTRQLLLIIWVIASSFSAAYGEEFTGDFVNNMVGEPYLVPRNSYSHLSVNATVTRVASNTVFLQTEAKTIRTIGVKAVRSEGIPSLMAGDKVDLILDRGNTILAVTEAGGKGGGPGNEITGTVQHFNILNRWIVLKSEKGEIQRFDLRDAVATKLNGVSKGRKVVLELDAKNRAIDAYRPE